MRYMHACGDGLRFNYAGKTPAGQGRILGLQQGQQANIVGTFYPYIWLGGGERGLAWFADSDQGWSLDETRPTLELERAGGVLTLRVNFITQPTALDRQRAQLVFGLQATPAKPMPEPPVNWRRWLRTRTTPTSRSSRFRSWARPTTTVAGATTSTPATRPVHLRGLLPGPRHGEVQSRRS